MFQKIKSLFENCGTSFCVLGRIAISQGLWLIILAPFLWGLLPLGYTYIKHDPNIRANPTFIVFMRMFCSFVLTAVFGFICFLVLREKKKLLKNMWCNLKTSWVFLILLSLCYFFARFVEMKCILGFTYENEESVNNVCATQVQHPYLAQGIDIEGVIKDLDGLTNGLNEVQLMDINLLKHEVTNNHALAQTAYLARNKESILSTNSLSKLEGLTNCVSKEKIEEVKKKLTPNGCIVKTATNGLQEFGYFMGLLLSLILVVKNHKVYGFLSKCSEKLKFKKISKKFEKQKGNPISFLGGLSMLITLFLIIASGVLNLAAREPLYAWSGIWEMLGWAFLVAILTSFAADFKGASSLCDGIDDGKENEKKKVDTKQLDEEMGDCGKEDSPVCDKKVDEGCDKNSAAIFSSFVVNAIMSLIAAILALGSWYCMELPKDKDCGFLKTFPELWGAFSANWGTGIWFWVVIVFLCSVVAPVCMLLGTQMHNNHLIEIKIDKYGISGKDWMQILSACEPLFVVLVGLLVLSAIGLGFSSWESVLSSKNPFISLCPILLSVFTVAIIIVLRLMETWAEKNSVLRNYVFTQVRGSSRGIPDRKDGENIEDFKKRIKVKYELQNDDIVAWSKKRALDLVWLKLYDKRNELESEGELKASLITEPSIIDDKGNSSTHPAIDAAADAANKSVPYSFSKSKAKYFVIAGCDKFFTQDDPVTHDVLSAIFDWLQMEQFQKENYIRIDSFSYLFKACCKRKGIPWKKEKEEEQDGLKDIACRGYTDATPFVLIVDKITEKKDDKDTTPVEIANKIAKDKIAKDIIKSLDDFLSEINNGKNKIEFEANKVILSELDRMKKEGKNGK